MQVSIQEFNDVINNGADAKVKDAIRRMLDRLKGDTSEGFEIERAATEIEEVFEHSLVDDFRERNS